MKIKGSGFFSFSLFLFVVGSNINNIGNKAKMKYLDCTPFIVFNPTSVNDKYIAVTTNNHIPTNIINKINLILFVSISLSILLVKDAYIKNIKLPIYMKSIPISIYGYR